MNEGRIIFLWPAISESLWLIASPVAAKSYFHLWCIVSDHKSPLKSPDQLAVKWRSRFIPSTESDGKDGGGGVLGISSRILVGVWALAVAW